jgi:hypothetical protein
MVSEQLDKSLFHESPMLFVIKHFKLIDNLILDDLLDDVLQGYNADDAVSWIATFLHINLCYNSNMGQTFLKIAEKWFQFVISGDVHSVPKKNTRQLLQ